MVLHRTLIAAAVLAATAPAWASTEEAARAGRAAAKFVRGGTPKSARVVKLTGRDGVRYTVPTTIRPGCAGDTVTLRFRVGGVYKNKKIAVYRGTDCIYSRKRPVLAPGEMEKIALPRPLLEKAVGSVTISVIAKEEANR